MISLRYTDVPFDTSFFLPPKILLESIAATHLSEAVRIELQESAHSVRRAEESIPFVGEHGRHDAVGHGAGVGGGQAWGETLAAGEFRSSLGHADRDKLCKWYCKMLYII